MTRASHTRPPEQRHEDCLACLAPLDQTTKRPWLAATAAMYCGMARTSVAIARDPEHPELAQSEAVLAKEILDQCRVLQDYRAQRGGEPLPRESADRHIPSPAAIQRRPQHEHSRGRQTDRDG
jgi:hypothetical protein